ncbi:MAG: cadherin-like domain-containing protein, partial [Planctomycetia bacterium]
DAGLIVYVNDSLSSFDDSFAFVVFSSAPDNVFESSGVFEIRVDVRLAVTNLGADVLQGESVVVDGSLLRYNVASVPQDPSGIVYTITAPPARGRLENIDLPFMPIGSFTQADLDAGRIVYIHDGSTADPDSFAFMVRSQDEINPFSDVGVFQLRVLPPQTLVSTNLGADVEQGSSVAVDGSLLNYNLSPRPIDPAQVVYFVTTPPARGRLAFVDAPLVPIAEFTQADLDLGRVVYVHDGLTLDPDSFAFTVISTDPQDGFETSGVFDLRVAPAPTLVVVSTGMPVDVGGSVVLTPAVLNTTVVGGTTTSILYEMTRPPTAGRLEFVDAPGTAISSFTQADVDAGRVRYVHDGS